MAFYHNNEQQSSADSTHKRNGWVDSEKYLISIAPTLCVGAQSRGVLRYHAGAG